MDSQIEQLVKECSVCSKSDKIRQTRRVPLSPVSVPKKPWDKLALDIIGPIYVVGLCKKCVLTMVGFNSHWVTAKFVYDVSTKVLIDFLWDSFNSEGIPAVIVTDNSVQFTSGEMKSFLSSLAIKHKRTALYCPKANGMAECINKMLIECIQALVESLLGVTVFL